MTDFEHLRRDCIPWIRQAGHITRERMASAHASLKADRSVVTDADQAVQDFIMDQIARRFPDDAVISEETQADPTRHASRAAAERCWVIDPIDGTRNYVRRVPLFAVSVGLLSRGVPVLGFIYNPISEQMYMAGKGAGAWLNDAPIKVAQGPHDEIFIGLPSGREEPLPNVVHGWIDRMVQRATGCTSLNLALVASGAFDAVFGNRCKLWDIAAGAIIVQEAGGVITDHQGHSYFPLNPATYRNQPTPFLAARPELLEDLLAELGG